MKTKALVAAVLLISACLMAVRMSQENNTQFEEGQYIHIDNMIITFDKTDATVDINYHVNSLVNIYIFLFGSKNLKPKIEEIFYDFPELNIQKIGLSSASLQLQNVSRKKGIFYLHDSRKLGMRTDVLKCVYPNGPPKVIYNATSTADTFY